MRKVYRTINDVLHSPWANLSLREGRPKQTDRILRSTKLEDSIYSDLRMGDKAMDEIESGAMEKLNSFSALSRDVYQSFYTLMLRRNEESELSSLAQKFNSKILDHIMQSEDYHTIKNICEGRELPAYEAATEFVSRTADELDQLLSDFGGEKGALGTLDKLRKAAQEAENDLAGLLERLRQSRERNETLEQATVEAANKAENKRRQAEAVSKMIDAVTAQNKEVLAAAIGSAAKAAADKAEEVQNIIGAWGNDPGNMGYSETNKALLEVVRNNQNLKRIAQYLGRFREIFAQGKRNGYAYGRGEKYAIELGGNPSRALTSELAMLATPVTAALFLRKVQKKQIKQYQRREPVYKGMGDIIVCLDESGSTAGDNAAWAKAVALALLDIADSGGRRFALIHFSGPGSYRTDVFRPGQYSAEDKMAAAECFLDGGTDFVTPMRESLRLIEQDGFENADIVFITDGNCDMPEDFVDKLRTEREKRGFTVTGILLDAGRHGRDFSLKAFCRKIYRTSERMGDEILQNILSDRV